MLWYAEASYENIGNDDDCDCIVKRLLFCVTVVVVNCGGEGGI